MFNPQYSITSKLLANIKRITELVVNLNNRHFSNVILYKLEESARELSTYASIKIEGNPLPLTEVKKVLKNKPDNARESEQEALNYNKALINLDSQIKRGQVDLTIDLLTNIQGQVTEKTLEPFQIGAIRKRAVVVRNPTTGEIAYIAPDAPDVESLLKDLFKFIKDNQKKIDPLILAGILHKQMVIIHPFEDGNGRTTRLITKALLAKMGLDTFYLFSFENYYNKNVTNYFRHVGEFGDYYELAQKGIDFTNWLEYFTDGIIDELIRVSTILLNSKIYLDKSLASWHYQILNHLKTHQTINDKTYSQLTDRSRASRILDFKLLVDKEIIERKGQARATHYVLKEISE